MKRSVLFLLSENTDAAALVDFARGLERRDYQYFVATPAIAQVLRRADIAHVREIMPWLTGSMPTNFETQIWMDQVFLGITGPANESEARRFTDSSVPNIQLVVCQFDSGTTPDMRSCVDRAVDAEKHVVINRGAWQGLLTALDDRDTSLFRRLSGQAMAALCNYYIQKR